MKNICIFIPTLKSGGAEKQAVLLSKVLQEDFNTYLVIWNGHLTEPKFTDYIEKFQIQTIYLSDSLLSRLLKLIRLLSKNKINIIFGYLASNNFYGSVAGKISGVDYIIGGIRNAEIPRFKLILQRFLHNNILDYTIFNNYSGRTNLVGYGFNADTCEVIPNCFDLEILPFIRPPSSVITIVSLARFVEQKDYSTAIKSIAYLAEKMKANQTISLTYQIIGYGVLEGEIRKLIADYQIEDITEIIINPSNIPDLLKNADIFLTTSLFEGTSNSVMEAMSFCLPVVSTDAGDNNKLIEENVSGYICDIGDFQTIGDRLFTLLTDYKKRIDFGNAAYYILKNDYSMEKFKTKYVEFINKIQLKN